MWPGDICQGPLSPSTMASSAGSNSGRFIDNRALSRFSVGTTRLTKRNRGKALGFSKITIPFGVIIAGENAFRTSFPALSRVACSMVRLLSEESANR
jgi:hypothetical protein